MHPVSTRIALAGSVLVMGSVGTVSAVNLQSAPAPMVPNAGIPGALAPLGTPPPLPPAQAVPGPPAALPEAVPPATNARRGGSGVLGTDDLVAIAKGPLQGRLVTVPVDSTVRRVAKPVRKLARPVRDAVGRVELDRPRQHARNQVVDRLVDRYQARTQRRIGDKFGDKFGDQFGEAIERRIQQRFQDRFGRTGTRAVTSRSTGDRGRHAADVRDHFGQGWMGSRSAGSGWAEEYVGRHRAE